MHLCSRTVQVKVSDQHEKHTVQNPCESSRRIKLAETDDSHSSRLRSTPRPCTQCAHYGGAAQAGYCVSVRHEEREVGQLCGGVNCCPCQQNDAGLITLRTKGTPEAGADPETTWIRFRVCIAHVVPSDVLNCGSEMRC